MKYKHKNEQISEGKYTTWEQFSNLGYAFRILWNTNNKVFWFRIPLILLKTLQLLVPIYAMRLILNELTTERDVRSVLICASIMAFLVFMIKCVVTILERLDTIEHMRLEIAIRVYLAESIMGLSYESLEDPKMQDMQWLASQNRLNSVLIYTSDIVSSLLTLVSVSVFTIRLNPAIIIIILLGTILRFYIGRFESLLSHKHNDERVKKIRILEYYKGLMNIPDFGMEIRTSNLENWIYYKTDANWRDNVFPLDCAFLKKKRVYSYSGAFLSVFQNISLYGFLSVQVVRGVLSIGDLSASLAAATTISSAIMGMYENYSKLMTNTSEYLRDYRRCLSNTGKQREVMVNRQIRQLDMQLPESVKIEFKNVSFKYPKTNRMILKNINITIEAGDTLSVIGHNGAGKTTFIKLLCRFYEPTEGQILINGRLATDIPLTQYYQMLSGVFQDYFIFEFSIHENIAMDTAINSNRMADCIDKCGLQTLIETLPQGGNTCLYKNYNIDGIEISSGEEQKVAIARAVYRKTPILIFDEPTSSLDPNAEYEIYNRFHSLLEKRTVIFVSHRLSLTKITNKTAVFVDGSIVEYGTHTELMKKNGVYKEMFDTQAQYYK